MQKQIFYGEVRCEGKYKSGKKNGQQCDNGAYYRSKTGKYLCGVHSKGLERTELKKNPRANEIRTENFTALLQNCMKGAEVRRKSGVSGKVACAKLAMRKILPEKEGFIPVLPNFKHGDRKDAIGCAKLSPMSLGPVVHKQPKVIDGKIVGMLPDAKNLENFWQGSKIFMGEQGIKKKEEKQIEMDLCDEILSQEKNLDICDDDNPDISETPEPKEDLEIAEIKIEIDEKFVETQEKWFLDDVPHRHKSKEKCLGWVWTNQNATREIFQYIESRQFYCHFYEKLASEEKEFIRLKNLVKKGVNLLIIGYDGIDIDSYGYPNQTFEEKLDKLYLDPKQPFGHELCLVTMLVLEPCDYPWRKHATKDFSALM